MKRNNVKIDIDSLLSKNVAYTFNILTYSL